MSISNHVFTIIKPTEIMNTKTLIPHTYCLKLNPLQFNSSPSQHSYTSCIKLYKLPHYPLFRIRTNRFITKGLSYEEDYNNDGIVAAVTSVSDIDEEEGVTVIKEESLWDQLVEILKFSGPAAGLWLCGPLMSLIDTAVIGQSSSVELAALGPGTVLCDYMSYGFMFLSVATSNLVATSLAKQDKSEVQHQISTLLFVGLTCGIMMLLFTRFRGEWALSAFSGAKNAHMLSAANTYIQVLWNLQSFFA